MVQKAHKPAKIVPDDHDDFLPTLGEKTAAELNYKAEIPKAVYERDIAPFTKSSDRFIAEIAHELPIWADRSKLHSAAKRAGVMVRAMRNYADLTQEVLGQDANVKQSVVSAIESGSGENGPTFELLSRIADACGCYVTFVPKTASKKPADLTYVELETAIREGVHVFLSSNVPVKAIKEAAAKAAQKKAAKRILLNPVTGELTLRDMESKARKTLRGLAGSPSMLKR